MYTPAGTLEGHALAKLDMPLATSNADDAKSPQRQKTAEKASILRKRQIH